MSTAKSNLLGQSARSSSLQQQQQQQQHQASSAIQTSSSSSLASSGSSGYIPSRPTMTSYRSNSSDNSVYSSPSNNGQIYGSATQDSTLINQIMGPPRTSSAQSEEVMLDPGQGSRYGLMSEQALRAPGSGSANQSMEDNLDNYMAGLQMQNRQDRQDNAQGTNNHQHYQYSSRSGTNGLMPSVSSPSYQNQPFDPAYPSSSSASSQPISPHRSGMFTQSSSLNSTSSSLSPSKGSETRAAEEDVFTSYVDSSPIHAIHSAGVAGSERELASKRERDLRLEEDIQKRGSIGSTRSELTAMASTPILPPGGFGNLGEMAKPEFSDFENPPTTSRSSSPTPAEISSPLGLGQGQEVDLISPPLPGSGLEASGFAALTAMGALDDKGREPITFDEGLLRALCDSPYALQLITERIKQSIASCKQFAAFLRSRAELEDKYARSGLELKRMSDDSYARGYCKAGTFVRAYKKSLEVHEALAQNRSRFAARLYEMSEELVNLAKEGERLRKLHKDNGARYERTVQEAEMYMDKAKSRFDTTAEELERILIAKEGESVKDSGNMVSPGSSSKDKRGLGKAMAKGGMLFKSKGPAQMQKQEDEVRQRMNSASEVFRKAVQSNQQTKQEYFNLHLPKILRLLKECADEIDMGTQYHMARYAYLYESTILAEATSVAPALPQDSVGLRAIVETIDNRADFTKYMQNYNAARGPVAVRAPQRESGYDSSFSPALPPHVQASQMIQNQHSSGTNGESSQIPSIPGAYHPGPPPVTGSTFGIELSDQIVSEGTEIPKVVEKCAQAIEAYGLDQMGIYRLSGTTSKVQRLKAALDVDLDAVDVMSDEWSGDINVVASVLKLWFRELPEPLLTHALYQGFIDAARYDNDRLRHIRLHEQVNELPDANYATLKYFMGHLDRIRRKESINQMSVSNLSIVFGPTLLGAPASAGGMNLEHMSFQCKAIETILERYKEIFVEEEEAPAA